LEQAIHTLDKGLNDTSKKNLNKHGKKAWQILMGSEWDENTASTQKAKKLLALLKPLVAVLSTLKKSGNASASIAELDRLEDALNSLKRELRMQPRDRRASVLAEWIETLQNNVVFWKQQGGQTELYTFAETARWQDLVNIGNLTPDLVTCLHPKGRTKFVESLIDLMGSPNNKLVLIKNKSGKAEGYFVIKLRKANDGRIYLHAEKSYGVRGFSEARFRKSVENFLRAKQAEMQKAGVQVQISRYLRGKEGEDVKTIELRSTGSYGVVEHSEDVFDVHNPKTLVHRAWPVLS
jgi:hypothetical protein